MRDTLLKWIGDADAIKHQKHFRIQELPLGMSYTENRRDDLYIALVGELFSMMRRSAKKSQSVKPDDWAYVGNAFGQFLGNVHTGVADNLTVGSKEASLFSAAAFFLGGFPASAYLIIKANSPEFDSDIDKACCELLVKSGLPESEEVRLLRELLVSGEMESISDLSDQVKAEMDEALFVGPDEWIPLRLFSVLLDRFQATNIRAVLPEGGSIFWDDLVKSFTNRGVWDFFPSQIEAITRGLLTEGGSFSLQMPTGAGKTALCETLLYYHLRQYPNSVAVLLVPYRSLASELKRSVVKRLNTMGIRSRSAYGGTVPTEAEKGAFDDLRALVATPETLSGILSVNHDFRDRISLIICDEGHLLDAESRGIGLELLLSRFKASQQSKARFVFVSAIVPNIEEINTWLGGTDDSVVRSQYRPAIAEYSKLTKNKHNNKVHDLHMHPHDADISYKLRSFLCPDDFRWFKTETKRYNTYNHSSIKTLAVAAARKSLPMGAAVIFCANKRGNQGAIGVAEELVKQLACDLKIANPIDYAGRTAVEETADYLTREYGPDWIGAKVVRLGAFLHHGDIPQETREVLEQQIADNHIRFGICTSTLAEGVNLPIRTLVLYSVQRMGADGTRTELSTRDIKNLVGRAGRAGANTKGLVICANEDQWPLVEAVALQEEGDDVKGALRELLQRASRAIGNRTGQIENSLLEQIPEFQSLIDGVDSVLIDLAVEELGEEEFKEMAVSLAEHTFAAQTGDASSKNLLNTIFSLRAERVLTIKDQARLGWIRETGAKVRLIDLVERELLPAYEDWGDVSDPLNEVFLEKILSFAWARDEIQTAFTVSFGIEKEAFTGNEKRRFIRFVTSWLKGNTFQKMALEAELKVDRALGAYTNLISYELQTLVEQSIALLEKMVESRLDLLPSAVTDFSDHLRYGVATNIGRMLATHGITHRRAYVTLGDAMENYYFGSTNRKFMFLEARKVMESDRLGWNEILGKLMLERTFSDLLILK